MTNVENTGNLLRKSADHLIAVSEKFIKFEAKYKLMRAKISMSAAIRELPNQAQRDAETDVYLNTHDKYRPLYEEYLNLRQQNRAAWINYEVSTELNKNARTDATRDFKKDK